MKKLVTCASLLAVLLLSACASLTSAPVSTGQNKPQAPVTAPVASGEADTGPAELVTPTQPAPSKVSFRFEDYETYDEFNYALRDKFPLGTHLNVVGRALLKAGARYLPKSQDPSSGHNFFYNTQVAGKSAVYTVKVFINDAKLVTRITGVFAFAKME